MNEEDSSDIEDWFKAVSLDEEAYYKHPSNDSNSWDIEVVSGDKKYLLKDVKCLDVTFRLNKEGHIDET